MSRRFARYDDFWLHYLGEHRRPRTRALHFLGTGLGIALLVAAALSGRWWLVVAAPVVGYACAWLGHGLIEGNRPATFGHPVWSLVSDVRMLGLFLTGRLAAELARAGCGGDIS